MGQLYRTITRKKLFRPIVSYNHEKKTFSAHCIVQSHEKNFFGPLYRTITRKKLFQPIVSYNHEKKTFSAHCIVQSLEKNFFRPIVPYNHMKKTFSAHCIVQSHETLSAHCIVQSHEKNFFGRLTESIAHQSPSAGLWRTFVRVSRTRRCFHSIIHIQNHPSCLISYKPTPGHCRS